MAKKKASKVEQVKALVPVPAQTETPRLDKQLSPEEYDALANQIQEFQDSSLSFLADTSNFEIVSTTDEIGRPIPDKNLELIRRECKRLGLKVLYSIDCGNHVLVINPNTMKTVMIKESLEMH